MTWGQVNRIINTSALILFLVAVAIGSIFFMGYPWNCSQAIKKRNEASLRLKQAQEGKYPPGSPYRQYRELAKREAEGVVAKKCEQNTVTSSSRRPAKFFLKDRSDY